MRTPRPLVPAVLVCLLVAGCVAGPTPKVWAAAVCEALAPWRAEISALTVRAQQQMTAETSPAQAQENLVRLLTGAQQASETARTRVEQAGVPDVQDGEAIAESFVRSLAAARDAYGRAGAAVGGLATGQADAFYTEVGRVMEQLNEEYGRSALDTTAFDSPELRAAFDEVPECR